MDVDCSKLRQHDAGMPGVILVSCGSFNPPTVMHMRMFDLAADALLKVGFDVWGGYMSPVSDGYKKPGLATARQRLDMCHAAAASHPWVMVDSWEASQTTYTRTLKVLQQIQERLNAWWDAAGRPQDYRSHAGCLTSNSEEKTAHTVATSIQQQPQRPPRVMLLTGKDVLLSMAIPGVWTQPEVIFQDFGVVSIERDLAPSPPTPATASATDHINNDDTKRSNPNIAQAPTTSSGCETTGQGHIHDGKHSDSRSELGLLERYADKTYLVHNPVPSTISSTRVRTELAAGRSVRYLVPCGVLSYLNEHKDLYRGQVIESICEAVEPDTGKVDKQCDSPASPLATDNAIHQHTCDSSLEGSPDAEDYDTFRTWAQLRHRRSSVILPAPRVATATTGLLGLAQVNSQNVRGKTKAAAQRRLASIQRMIQDLIDYYSEIDAFELIEESPGKARRKHKSQAPPARLHAQEPAATQQKARVRFSSLATIPASPIDELPEGQFPVPVVSPDGQLNIQSDAQHVPISSHADAHHSDDRVQSGEHHADGDDQDTGDGAAPARRRSSARKSSSSSSSIRRGASLSARASSLAPVLEEQNQSQDEQEQQGVDDQRQELNQQLCDAPAAAVHVGDVLQDQADAASDEEQEAAPARRRSTRRSGNALRRSALPQQAAAYDDVGDAGHAEGVEDNGNDVTDNAAEPRLNTRITRSTSRSRQSQQNRDGAAIGHHAAEQQHQELDMHSQKADSQATRSVRHSSRQVSQLVKEFEARMPQPTTSHNSMISLARATLQEHPEAISCRYEDAPKQQSSTASGSVIETAPSHENSPTVEYHQQQQQYAASNSICHAALDRHVGSDDSVADVDNLVASLGSLTTADHPNQSTLIDALGHFNQAQTVAEDVRAEDHSQHTLQQQQQQQQGEDDIKAEECSTELQQLLKICGQSTGVADIPTMSEFLSDMADLRKVVKVGEGTYGEAFKQGKMVFKVIPVDGQHLVNDFPQKRAGEVAAEALVALALTQLNDTHDASAERRVKANMTPCFVQTHKVGVCKGPYAPSLVKAWHKWDKANGSENDPVDTIGVGPLPEDADHTHADDTNGRAGGSSSNSKKQGSKDTLCGRDQDQHGDSAKKKKANNAKGGKASGSAKQSADVQQEEPQSHQYFMVLAMSDCGRDLEKENVPSFNHARALMTQVAFTLAAAECELEFEHRDLHWGNVLVRTTTQGELPCRVKDVDILLKTQGMQVSLIDFTASRLRTQDGSLAFCDLAQDPELFTGPQKHVQFDTYRWMQEITNNDWSSTCLATNCLWMSYLAEILAAHKSQHWTSSQKRQVREFRKRACGAGSCTDLLDDPLFDGMWEPVQ